MELMPSRLRQISATSGGAPLRPPRGDSTSALPKQLVPGELRRDFRRQRREEVIAGAAVDIVDVEILLPMRAPLRPEAAKAAAAQGRFREIHELPFATSDRFTDRDLFGYVSKPGHDEGTYQGHSPASRKAPRDAA